MRAGVSRVEGGFLHPALDPPPSYTAAQLHPAAGFGRVSPRRGVEGGGFGVEGGFRGLKLGRRNSWGGFLPRHGG